MYLQYSGLFSQHGSSSMPTPNQTPDLQGTKGLSIERLFSFCRVVEAGGLSKAAKLSRQDLSQVSRQFSDLEVFFGRPLASRTKREFALNEFGEDLYELASGFIHSVAKLRDRCAEKHQVFSLAAGGGLVSWLVFPRVNRLRSVQPGARFIIKSHRTKDIVNGVISNQIDFGLVRRSAINDRRIDFEPMGILDYALFVSGQTAEVNQITPQTHPLQVISKVPLILIDGDGEFRKKLDRDAREQNIILNSFIDCGSYTDAAIAVASSFACSILPNLAEQQFGDSDFLQLPWINNDLSREICLIWSKSGLRTGGRAKRHLHGHLKSILRFGRPQQAAKKT